MSWKTRGSRIQKEEKGKCCRFVKAIYIVVCSNIRCQIYFCKKLFICSFNRTLLPFLNLFTNALPTHTQVVKLHKCASAPQVFTISVKTVKFGFKVEQFFRREGNLIQASLCTGEGATTGRRFPCLTKETLYLYRDLCI